MNINALKTALLTGAVSLGAHVSAQAVTVLPNITTEFLDAITAPGTNSHTASTPGVAALIWKDDSCGTCSANRLRFDSVGPASYNILPSALGSPFTLGVLHFKNLTGPAASGLESAQLDLSVLLWDTMVDPLNLIFDLTLQPTAHNSHTGDLVSISYDTDSYLFSTAEGSFQLDILGWSNDRGNSFTNSLSVADYTFGGMRLYGVVTSVMAPVPSAVPIPAAAWLLGSGLLALTGVARRRQHA